MATVTSTTTEVPAWKLRLRSTKLQVQSFQANDNMAGYFSANPSSFGVDLQSIRDAPGSVEKLEEHAGMLKQTLTLLSASAASSDNTTSGSTTSVSVDFKPISKTLIAEHQKASDELKDETQKIKDDKATKKTAKERMEAGREKAKKKSSASIDKAFDAAEVRIDSLPEADQDKATDVWLGISDAFLVFWDKVLAGFLAILNAIVDWLATVWDTVKTAWNTVKNVFVDAWKWFSGLF